MEKIDYEFKTFLLCCHGRKNVRPAVRMLDARADNNNNNNNNNKKKKKKNIQLYLSRVALDSIKYW